MEAVRRDQALLKSGEQAFVATLGFLAGKGLVACAPVCVCWEEARGSGDTETSTTALTAGFEGCQGGRVGWSASGVGGCQEGPGTAEEWGAGICGNTRFPGRSVALVWAHDGMGRVFCALASNSRAPTAGFEWVKGSVVLGVGWMCVEGEGRLWGGRGSRRRRCYKGYASSYAATAWVEPSIGRAEGFNCNSLHSVPICLLSLQPVVCAPLLSAISKSPTTGCRDSMSLLARTGEDWWC